MKWNTELYNQKHNFVYQYGQGIVELLDAKPYERILDLGCGTGELTDKIKEKGALVTGVDSSVEMIEKAKENFPLINFEVKDGSALNYHEEFDAVFSNAALHWMTAKEKVVAGIAAALKHGGRLVAEFGGKNNIRNISEAVKKALIKRNYSTTEFWYFPSTAEYSTLLEKNGFRVLSIQHIERPTELIGEDGMKNWIRMFCTGYFSNQSADEKEQIINEVVEVLRSSNYQEGKWYGDYYRLRVVAVKEY